MTKRKNEYLYAWACDFSKSRGEGLLARKFINDCTIQKYKKIYINGKEYSKLKKKNIIFKTNFLRNYFYPFWGLLNIWLSHLSKKKTIYLNYLPLWNFLLFLFLPKETILGPITGGANYSKSKSFQYYVRKYLFPILYEISLKIIQKKFNQVIFSTDLLKPYIKKENNFIFNYCLNIYDKKNLNKNKKYDLIFYYRLNKNKNNLLQKNLIKKLIINNYKVIIIGDNPYLKNSSYIGDLEREKALNYISQSKFAINNTENVHSLFCLDSLSCGTRVIHFGQKNSQEMYFNRGSIFQKKTNDVKKQFIFLRNLLNNESSAKIKVNKEYFLNKKKINKHFKNLNL